MKTLSVVVTVLLLSLLVTACSTAPSVLKGTILMKTETEAHINLGSDNGIQVGDTLSVWRDENRPNRMLRSYQVGTVRVVRFLDKNNSTVATITGGLQEGDRVEKGSR